MPPPLVILGCGFTGAAAARAALARAERVIATTRDPERAVALARLGVEAHAAASLTGDFVRATVPPGARVLATFPPDGRTDAVVAGAMPAGCACVYVSTTGVYGDRRGRIDERTPVDASSAKAAQRLDAELAWRSIGAAVLRAAGIYGPHRGLHRRILAGTFRTPGDGANVVSRIHVDDLAALCLAALSRDVRGEVFVAADDAPVPQGEVVRWLSARLGLPGPARASLDDVPETLRHDRAIDNATTKRRLGVTLAYPTWREGFEQCLAAEAQGDSGSVATETDSSTARPGRG